MEYTSNGILYLDDIIYGSVSRMKTTNIWSNQKMTSMQITDNKGQKITVINLPSAIKQAALFMQYCHKDPGRSRRDDELKIYWSHMHSKLLELRSMADADK